MCGPGSGNRRPRAARRTTVEEAFSLPLSVLRRDLCPGASGTVRWHRPVAGWSAGYAVSRAGGGLAVTLSYEADGTPVRLPVRLCSTVPPFGGSRWWFACPTCEGPVAARAGKLYRPRGATDGVRRRGP